MKAARRAFGWALGGVLALQLGATGVLIARSCGANAPVPVAATIATLPLPLIVPIPIETTRATPSAEHASCPIPRRDAPVVTPILAEPVTSVQPAPTNAGWIAAWNTEHVFVSTDAGTTFTRVLDGDGAVASVSFDCFGHVLAVRGTKLGIRDGNDERWREIPALRGDSEDAMLILGGGPDVVVIGNLPPQDTRYGRMAISADLGATWRYRDLGTAFESGTHAQGWQDATGTIHAAISVADCMNDDLAWITVKGDDVDVVNDGMGEGASFAIYDGDLVIADRAWRSRHGDTWNEITDFPAPRPDIYEGVVVVPGAIPTIVMGETAYRIKRGRVQALPWVVEGTPQAVDLAGRLWTIACGKPLIATRHATGAIAGCSGADI